MVFSCHSKYRFNFFLFHCPIIFYKYRYTVFYLAHSLVSEPFKVFSVFHLYTYYCKEPTCLCTRCQGFSKVHTKKNWSPDNSATVFQNCHLVSHQIPKCILVFPLPLTLILSKFEYLFAFYWLPLRPSFFLQVCKPFVFFSPIFPEWCFYMGTLICSVFVSDMRQLTSFPSKYAM